ncbi:hypothetical protein BH11BAC3_BH11BAC3_00090 [soil metagenome]
MGNQNLQSGTTFLAENFKVTLNNPLLVLQLCLLNLQAQI